MEVRVLGPLQVVDGDRAVDLRGLRQRAVLAVLVIEAGRVVSSDALADLVWDGEPPEQAQTSLQAYVSKLRRALEPGSDGKGRPWQHLITRAPGYVFEIDREAIDAVRFEAAADRGAARLRDGAPEDALDHLDAALAMWRGEPYADFAFSGFARSEIARLTELRWRVVEDRAEAWLALGRHRESVADLDSLTRAAPLRERLRGQLALALYRSGRQADALASLSDARTLLLDDLGLDPGPELRRLEQGILEQDPALDHRPPEAPVTTAGPAAAPARTGPLGPPAPAAGVALAGGATSPARPPMVGRDAELTRALGAVHAAQHGAGGLVIATGEAGIGKTRLAEETAHQAATLGVDVLWGRCPELEGAPPFWPWTQVLRALFAARPDLTAPPLLHALVPELVAAPPGAPEAGGEASLFQVYDAVATVLALAARTRPLLVVVEDLHWADAATLRLLRFMATVAPAASYSVLATSRDEGASTTLDELRAEAARTGRIDVVDLPHLDREAVGRLVADLAGDAAPASTIDGVLARSGGNPFYVGELVRSGEAGVAAVPTGVRDVIARRVSQLAEPVQHLLAMASCCPDDFGLDVMAVALERPTGDVIDDVDAALAARLLHEVPDRAGRFRFAHPLVRDAVNDRLSSARRAQLHLVLADALEPPDPYTASDELAAELIHHLGHAAVLGTATRAVAWSVEVGRRDLARWAAEDAERRFSGALALAEEFGGVDEGTQVDLLTGLGRARRFLGLGSSREVLKTAITRARALGDPQRIVWAALSTAEGAWGLGTSFGIVDRELVEAIQWAVDHLDLDEPENRALHVAARSYLACELIFDEDPRAAITMSGAALADARALGGSRLLAGAIVGHYVTTWGPETVPDRAALLADLGAIVERTGYQRDRWLLLRWTAGIEAGAFDELDRVLAEVDDVMADGARPSLSTLLAWRRSLRATLDGDFVEAERLIFEAHELSASLSPDEAVDATGGQLALLYWLWGRLSTLVPLLEIALEEQPYMFHAFGPVLALARIYDGDVDEGRALLHELDLGAHESLPATMARSGTISAYATACHELGDPDLARIGLRMLGAEALDESAPTLVDHVGVFYLGARAAYRGILLLVLDEVEPAIVALERGLAVDQRANAPIFALRDQLHLADALRRRGADGDQERAAALVAEASVVARRLELVHDLRYADRLRRDLGVDASA